MKESRQSEGKNSLHDHPAAKPSALGISGRLAHYFQRSRLTPLLALVAFLLGVFAVLVTPREEEPQIDVTMANVIVAFPGASARDVEQLVSSPAEQVLSRMQGVEHVSSISQQGMALITVQFKVGVPRQAALVRLYDTVNSNSDWLPPALGVLPPVVKPKGIDDVPIVTLTLHGTRPDQTPYDLERVAHSMEESLKRVPGTQDVRTIGGPGRAVQIAVDPARLTALGVTLAQVRQAIQTANAGTPTGHLLQANRSIALEVGGFLHTAQEVRELVVGVQNQHPIFLSDVAEVNEGPMPAQHTVWFGYGNDPETLGRFKAGSEFPAVTLSITKKAGENAIEVANGIQAQVHQLKNTLIPADIAVVETRNYGSTANEKATKLIQKLFFATLSVVVLVMVLLGRREAAIVGVAVILTLTVTLFASWAWGFTLNRVSLFALIFSIGILVDDAIVVVENIHRHQQLHPSLPLEEIIPAAVDEVGGPTILATLTVIAALLPMAFVSGLMGPYMSPIPINASMGMLLSLGIAFMLTPWLARLWLSSDAAHAASSSQLQNVMTRSFQAIFRPLLNPISGTRNRFVLGLGIMGLIALAVALPIVGLVHLKMLPFDNKSEFQVLVDLPKGTPVEQTAAALQEMGQYVATIPEVINYQLYAGTAAPINFNGLVRQYELRQGSEQGDLQVNLVGKHDRKRQSHAIATDARTALVAIGKRYGATVKVVEVPPGPPVQSPIVAEVYGPTASGRLTVSKQLGQIFQQTANVVDVDQSPRDTGPQLSVVVDRQKAARLGVDQASLVTTLRGGLEGEAIGYMHDLQKYPTPIVLRLPASQQGDLNRLLALTVRSQTSGLPVPIRELVSLEGGQTQQPIFHKDLMPVNYVVGDMAGKLDSPLYGLFAMRDRLKDLRAPDGQQLEEYFIHRPIDEYHRYAVKWEGEWQITYETFRDMGLAYGVGLILIYLLVVAQFGSYRTPLIIMAPIPLTIIGVMPGHALLGAQFTATSMIGMIALAGIIVRNSILLVDFIRLQTESGTPFAEAVVQSAITRAQPIFLTGLAAMLGAFFILDDPIFNGLAISLIFGILVSTLLTLVVIPLLYYVTYRERVARTGHVYER